MKYYFVYVLRSIKDGFFYTGFTQDLEKRLKTHNRGFVKSTKNRVPFELIYYVQRTPIFATYDIIYGEACNNLEDALHREKHLKTPTF